MDQKCFHIRELHIRLVSSATWLLARLITFYSDRYQFSTSIRVHEVRFAAWLIAKWIVWNSEPCNLLMIKKVLPSEIEFSCNFLVALIPNGFRLKQWINPIFDFSRESRIFELFWWHSILEELELFRCISGKFVFFQYLELTI